MAQIVQVGQAGQPATPAEKAKAAKLNKKFAELFQTDPRYAQADDIMASGMKANNGSILGAIGAGVAGGVSGYQKGKLEKEYGDRQGTFNKDVGAMFDMYRKGGDVNALEVGDDASELKQQIMLSDIEAQRTAAADQSKFDREAALKIKLQSMRGQGGGQYVDPDTGEIVQSYSNKPLPATAMNAQNELTSGLNAAQKVQNTSQKLADQVDSGDLDLGLVQNIVNKGRNIIGKSTPESINLDQADLALEGMRNDVLMLHKGVQTEGDAIRAMNTLVKSKNDPNAFKAAMERLNQLNAQASELKKAQINDLRSNWNAAPYDFSRLDAANGQAQTTPPPQKQMTAIGPNGQRLMVQNGAWVPMQ